MKMKLLFIWIFLPLCIYAQSKKDMALSFISTIDKPVFADFSPVFHLPPINQDSTNACWSFATCAFAESEMGSGNPVRIAMMYPVYCEFMEKARLSAKTHGTSRFAEGGLFSGALNTFKNYGIIPESAYKGQTNFNGVYSHKQLFSSLKAYVAEVRKDSSWDSPGFLTGVRRILDKYLGAPPEKFTYNGREFTPATFRDEITGIKTAKFKAITSFSYSPFNRYISLNVPDNYMKDSCFYNLPLDEFYSAIKSSLTQGHAVAIDADISEPYYTAGNAYLAVPDFDIPVKDINQQAREERFIKGETSDDHLMEIVGYINYKGTDWFLAKDSWRTAFQHGAPEGYMFMNASYIKLKILAALIGN